MHTGDERCDTEPVEKGDEPVDPRKRRTGYRTATLTSRVVESAMLDFTEGRFPESPGESVAWG